jgi:UPF0716 family protein affecting phage T7 exclusion
MKKFILLLLLGIAAVLALELWVLLEVMHLVKDVLGPLLALVVLSVIGFKVVGMHVRRLPAAFISGAIGPRLIGLVGGVLLVIPGFLTAVLGAFLQIPLLQRWCGGIGSRLAGSLSRYAQGSGMGPLAGMGGFPSTGGFPGMFPRLKPDEQLRTGPRTYDTTAERDQERPR